MAFHSIPVTLITGYLGSGKTTLINHILSNAKGHKMAVIVNDIGEVNIDAELIDSQGVVTAKDENLVALQNGCICCTLKADLLNQLADLVNSHQFDHILIEASGICEPVPIAQSICYMVEEFKRQKLPKFYYLDAIVSVTDALRLKDEFAYGESLTPEGASEEEETIESLIVQQLEFCDIVLLNKASELTPDELNKVTLAIRGIQRNATIVPTDYAKIDVDEILDTHLFDFEKASTSATWIAEFESWDNEHDDDDDDDEEEHEHHHHDDDDDDDEHEHEHEHHHHHHHHHHEHGMDQNDDEGTAEEYGIQTYVYYRRTPFAKDAFIEWTKTNPHKIIRAKGMAYFKEEDDISYIYESAGRQIKLSQHGKWFSETHSQKEIDALRKQNPYYAHDYDETYKDKLIKLVFIGQNLNKKAIKKELDLI